MQEVGLEPAAPRPMGTRGCGTVSVAIASAPVSITGSDRSMCRRPGTPATQGGIDDVHVHGHRFERGTHGL